MTRKFPGLPPGHPAIGRQCAICGEAFVEGSETCLVPMEIPTGSLTVPGALLHWTCYQEALP